MKASLFLFALINVVACVNLKSDNTIRSSKDSTELIVEDSTSNGRKEKIRLIETVLNLPDVIRASKLKAVRKEYSDIYILLKNSEFGNSKPRIVQNGHELKSGKFSRFN